MTSRLPSLPAREQRGSRARCILLTDGSHEQVADRLTQLVQTFAVIDPARHVWIPRGFDSPAEAKLGDATRLLPAETREVLTEWWLAVRERANTPNWDIASTATVEGREGLVLVEAKAHSRELKRAGQGAGNERNRRQIAAAVSAADRGLKELDVAWELSCDAHYQLANRFAWSWKLASLGVPVVLVYLGFLNANEMRDRGNLFRSADDWDQALRAHARGIVPEDAWGGRHDIKGTAMVPVIRSMELPLDTE